MRNLPRVLAAVLLAFPLAAAGAAQVSAAATPGCGGTYAWVSANQNDAYTWPDGEGGTGLVNGQITNADEWSGDGAAEQMCANSPSDVAVTSSQPDGNTAVESYPDIQYNFPQSGQTAIPFGQTISSLKEVRSYFTETQPQSDATSGVGIGPNGVDNEFASDDLLWNPGKTSGNAYEVMDWTANQGQSPGGHLQTQDGILHIAGHYYELWCGYAGDAGQNLPCNPPAMDNQFYGYFVFFEVNPADCATPGDSCPSADDTSGYIPHWALAEWLIRHGLMLANTVFAQENIGWEICGDPAAGGTYAITGSRLIVRQAASPARTLRIP